MNAFLSTALQNYYAQERATLATETAIRAELRQFGITDVHAEYDGVGDSGQIDQISYHNDANPAQPVSIDASINDRVESLLYALLNLRHSGWENNDGASGTFRWNLVDGTLEHVHHQRYTSADISVHEGFDLGVQP